MAITTAQIQQLYVAYLGRAADKAGLDYWSQQLNAEKPVLTLENLRANFVNEQAEYKDAYAGLSRQDTVIKIYNNLFGRAPDAAGLEYWATGDGSLVNPDQLLTAFINGASADDAKVITNKVLVSEVYTSTAGSNYVQADAKTIIANVGADGTSVGDALNLLTDGSLSGLAIPVAVANLKAAAAAEAAVTSFESSKAADLLAIENKLVALSKSDSNLVPQLTPLKDGASFDSVNTELGGASGDLALARGSLGTTKDLTTAAGTKAEALVDARTALTAADKASVAHVTAYTAALAAVKAAPAISQADETQAVNTLSAFGANSANATAWTKALADAGITANADPANAAATAQTIYNALTNPASSAAASVAQAKAAFASFTSVIAISDKDLAAQKAANALIDAAKPLNELKDATTGLASDAGKDWIKAVGDDATAQSKLASSKALDALDAAYKTITDGYKATTDSQKAAELKLDPNALLDDTAGALTAPAATTKAEVFYFAQNKVTDSDGSLTLTAGGDSLYIGEGYTLNKSATLGANGIAQADNNAKEVFFFKAADNSVKAVIETSVIGSTTVGDNGLGNHVDGVSVITLTGVTDISQVTFANGVISHVA